MATPLHSSKVITIHSPFWNHRSSVGLVYESHLPEKVRLPDHQIRRGVSVEEKAVKPGDAVTWRVVKVRDGEAVLHRTPQGEPTVEAIKPIEELVVVREFGEPIYPGLKSVGKVERGGDKPFHTVINAENYHALETLLYTYEGQVDCIYIDPPYNTGARDWKYNNDYVDGEDGYRHSKWLSFIEKRLELAKRLLNPESSVLVITIDANEVHHLGVLLEQTFPKSLRQMATIVITPSGASGDGLSRVEEYAFFVFIGAAEPQPLLDDLLSPEDTVISEELLDEEDAKKVRWESLLRGGSKWHRSKSNGMCYPILLDPETHKIVGTGKPLEPDVPDDQRPSTIDGFLAAWPVRSDGRLGIWRLAAETLKSHTRLGYAYTSAHNKAKSTWTFKYLMTGTVEAIERGAVVVKGIGANGQADLEVVGDLTTTAKTVWNRGRHVAGGLWGTLLLTNLLGEKGVFTYPKSLYAVRDALLVALGNKPDALVLDFFGGSGTTLHAVALLNQEDGGRRRALVVTNNEVDGETSDLLAEKGVLPGDEQFEAVGVFNSATMPRCRAAITGHTRDGAALTGHYLGTSKRPLSDGLQENVEFFTLTYEDADRVKLGAAFEAIAPILWLKAGAQGPRIDRREDAWALPKGGRYGVLFDPDHWVSFTAAIQAAEGVTHAFIVTDSDSVFHRVVSELPDGVESVRLYESYLSSFAINTGAIV